MKARDLIYETATALDANRGRSLLTILGIVIGISAVIAMTALIGGLNKALVGELGLNQARMVMIYCYPDREMTLDDLAELERRMPEYECLSASTWAGGKAKSDTRTWDANIVGVMPSHFKIQGSKVAQGGFFTQKDEDSGAMVCVLDQGAVRQLFGKPDEQVVGKTIQIEGANYSIVGVEETVSSGNSGFIYLPFSTCASRLSGSWAVNEINALAVEGANMDTIAESTKQTIAKYFNMDEESAEDNIYVQTMKAIIDELDAMTGSFEVLMTAVASISLLVGGIGIMNMMLTNVTERIREIGLRKALGARRSDITKQFLLESVCLCLAGGVFGILFGYLGAYALAGVAGGAFGDAFIGSETTIVPIIDFKSVAMATGICVLIGVLFGYYPARRAARLDPVESLHYQ